MIYERKHVRALIRKKVLGILTREEQAEYQLLKRVYTEEKFDEMIAETLLEMEDELPEDSLTDWKPDFDAIRSIAEQRRRSRKKPPWRKVGWAAAVLIPLMTMFVYWYATHEQLPDFPHGPCAGLTGDVEVPVTESVVSIKWGDTAHRKVVSGEYGLVLRQGNIQVFKTDDGIFQLRQRKGEPAGGIVLETGVQQQAMVELPDGTYIRLNAQSSLQYAPEKQKKEQLKVQGEAFVQRPAKQKATPLSIGTRNGFVTSLYGDFVLLSREQFTRAAALGGKLSLHANSRKEALQLGCYGAQGSVARFVNTKGQEKDSLLYQELKDPDVLLVWTKAVRTYKDIPLREFVAQMSSWYGFQVKDYSCLPADKRISARVCYRRGREGVFAAIREAGVLLYESKGMISFCPEDAELIKKNEGPLAWWE
jgi:hypothetical protein